MAGEGGDVELGEEKFVDVIVHLLRLFVLLHEPRDCLRRRLSRRPQARGAGGGGGGAELVESEAGEHADVVGVVEAPGKQLVHQLGDRPLRFLPPQDELVLLSLASSRSCVGDVGADGEVGDDHDGGGEGDVGVVLTEEGEEEAAQEQRLPAEAAEQGELDVVAHRLALLG
eukprot:748438-Hanusia_phi.AAC.4